MELGLKEDPESSLGLAPLSQRHVHAHTRQQVSNWFLKGARPLRCGKERENERGRRGERERKNAATTNVLCCHLKDKTEQKMTKSIIQIMLLPFVKSANGFSFAQRINSTLLSLLTKNYRELHALLCLFTNLICHFLTFPLCFRALCLEKTLPPEFCIVAYFSSSDLSLIFTAYSERPSQTFHTKVATQSSYLKMVNLCIAMIFDIQLICLLFIPPPIKNGSM